MERSKKKNDEQKTGWLAKALSFSPYQEQKPRIEKKRIEECKREIENYLNLESKSDLCTHIRSCLTQRIQLSQLQDPYNRAQDMLGMYYQPGKIRDLLKKIFGFIDKADTMEDPEMARIMGYNNYCFFLRNHMARIRQGYRPQEVKQLPEKAADRADVQSFIEEECSAIVILKDMLIVLSLCRELLGKIQGSQKLVKSDLEKYSKITDYLETMRMLQFQRLAVDELRKLLESLKKQHEAVIQTIEEANQLTGSLCEALPDALFDPLDPSVENARINEMTVPEIKELYQLSFEHLREFVLS